MTIGIVVVCTNAYFILGVRFVKKFLYHYKGPHAIRFFLFTDTDPTPYLPGAPVTYFHTVHRCWQDGTNSKFSNILKLSTEPCDYIYYFDADTDIGAPFTEDWFLGDLVGGEHYNNRWKDASGAMLKKPYDRNPLSRAYIPLDTPLPQTYYYGAFFGGRKQQLLTFCQTLYENQQADALIGYEPSVNDESYINQYFHYTPPTFVVPSNKFAFFVSHKGGIGETRNTALDIDALKQVILTNPTRLFMLEHGKIHFH